MAQHNTTQSVADLIRLKKDELDRDVINYTNYINNTNDTNDTNITNEINNTNNPTRLVSSGNGSSPTRLALARVEDKDISSDSCLRVDGEAAYGHIKVDLWRNSSVKSITQLKIALALNYNPRDRSVIERIGFHLTNTRIRDYWRGIDRRDRWYDDTLEQYRHILDILKTDDYNIRPRIGKGYRMMTKADRKIGGTIIQPHTACVLYGNIPLPMFCILFIEDMSPIHIKFENDSLTDKQRKSGQIGTFIDGSRKARVYEGKSITERLIADNLKRV